ncbi:MAG: TetR/AcrR family transcriptional regulator [Proteobacteria bacterium]|nr:TetR/AcrR family transcriptional regulator [Pseudomonadota bacterium]
MAPKIVNKDEKRLQIALAAVEIFGVKGFDRTRIDDVAREAGVGKGTIYEYFKNKEELMDGALQSLLANMYEKLLPSPDPERSPLETLKELSRKTIEAMADLGGAYRFFLEYTLHASRKGDDYGQFSQLLTEFRQGLAELIEAGKQLGEFRSDIDSFETAAAFAAWFDGAIFHWITLPGTVSLETMGERFLDMVLCGLMPADKTEKGRRQ